MFFIFFIDVLMKNLLNIFKILFHFYKTIQENHALPENNVCLGFHLENVEK